MVPVIQMSFDFTLPYLAVTRQKMSCSKRRAKHKYLVPYPVTVFIQGMIYLPQQCICSVQLITSDQSQVKIDSEKWGKRSRWPNSCSLERLNNWVINSTTNKSYLHRWHLCETLPFPLPTLLQSLLSLLVLGSTFIHLTNMSWTHTISQVLQVLTYLKMVCVCVHIHVHKNTQ